MIEVNDSNVPRGAICGGSEEQGVSKQLVAEYAGFGRKEYFNGGSIVVDSRDDAFYARYCRDKASGQPAVTSE